MVGTYCCVPGCFNNTLKNKELSFHVFPKDETLRGVWIRNLSRLDERKFSVWQPKTHHKVCDAHFAGGKKTYMNNVPIVFPVKVERSRRKEQARLLLLGAKEITPPGSSGQQKLKREDPVQKVVQCWFEATEEFLPDCSELVDWSVLKNSAANLNEYTTTVTDFINCNLAWCKDNNLSINYSKMKELVIDFRKQSAWYVSVCINGAEVEMVESVKFLGVMITLMAILGKWVLMHEEKLDMLGLNGRS
eukprot:g46908.t1